MKKIINIDAVFLSKTSDEHIFNMTTNALHSLRNSKEWRGKIIIVETNTKEFLNEKKFLYDNCQIIFPNEEFNYNRFLNFGIEKTDSEWILLCNNDIIFDSGWYRNMIDVIHNNPEIKSFSPKNPNIKKHNFLKDGLEIGYDVGGCLTGWCLLLHKSVLEICGSFDERFEFWYQDNDYAERLKRNNVKHALVSNFIVYHLKNKSHHLLKNKNLMTHGQRKIFIDKWI